MDDWQGCLAPDCQAALVKARDSIGERGGSVITVEDFLLALLDTCPDVVRFLRGSGVDLDELIRTVQCEQPIVTEVGGEGLLSSQLVDWLARSRELTDAPWLVWGLLLKVLVSSMERLRDKAYVAVLELVSHWPCGTAEELPFAIAAKADAPLVITSDAWLNLAEDVAVLVSTASQSLVWVRGERGAGKSSWLPGMLAALPGDYLELDLRREADVLASDLPALPRPDESKLGHWPLLVLDNTSPSDLLMLVNREGSLARELVVGWPGPILLLSEEKEADGQCGLDHRLGRRLKAFDLPVSNDVQREAVLTAHQARIEKQWRVEIPLSTIRFAAANRNALIATPGAMLEWVERAAARLDLYARLGPMSQRALHGKSITLRRQNLVAMARGEPTPPLMPDALAEMDRQREAVEQLWQDRRGAGVLRRLVESDLRAELKRWLAADPAPVHYVRHCNQQDGDSAGAGSGNIHP